MKIVVYGTEKRVGAVQEGAVVDLSLAFAKYLHEKTGERHAVEVAAALVPSDLARLIERGPTAIEDCGKALAHLFGEATNQLGPNGETIVHAAGDVRLHAPRPSRARIACAGGNYADHHLAMAQRRTGGKEEAASLTLAGVANAIRKSGFWGFWKIDRDAAGPEDEIPYPARAQRLDYEGEVAIVIGKQGRDIAAADLQSYIWGVTLLNDWSVRGGVEAGRYNFAVAKNFDNSCSLGPCIVVGELDPSAVDVETFVNGDRRQNYNSRDMVFKFGEILEYLSRDLTLYPGDIVSGGTAAGTAADSSPILGDGIVSPERFLKPGDVVEVRSPAIGVLRNRIVARKE